MRLKSLPCLAALALGVGLSSAVASPLGQTGGVATAAPAEIQMAQSDDRDRRRRRDNRAGESRRGGGDNDRGGRAGNSRDGRDGGSRGGGGNQGTVFCNPQLGCVRDLNINPGSGLGR